MTAEQHAACHSWAAIVPGFWAGGLFGLGSYALGVAAGAWTALQVLAVVIGRSQLE